MKRTNLILLTLIFSLSFTFWSIAQQHNKSWEGNQRHERIAEKLNLTEEQQSAIEQLKIENQKEMIDLKSDLEKKKLELKELKSEGNYTRDVFLNLVKAINNAKNNIALAKANNRMDIYELLTAEQKKSFDKMGKDFGKHKKMRKHREKKGD